MPVALYSRQDMLDHQPRAIAGVARRRRDGKLVSTLEGGYDLRGLAESTVAHVRALQGE